MSWRSGEACVAVVAFVAIGCNAASRYEVLSFLFDGVPPPRVEAPVATQEGGAGTGVRARSVVAGVHGPYGAKMCNACHQSAATNALVLPIQQLCFQCHDLKLDKKYIHGPLASGGCKSCHDPHSSRYRYLLVSESDEFCFYCHERQTVAGVPAHAGIQEQCTGCHDAHMSDKKYLLR